MPAILDTAPFPFHLPEARQLLKTLQQVHPTAVAALAGCELAPSRRPFARPVPLGVLAREHTHPTDGGLS